MRRRILGVETEHGLTCAGTGGAASPISADEAARYLFAGMVARGRSTNAFLRNGGRLYLDVGSHPEYATAECDRLADLLAQDRAGSEILADMASAGDARLREAGVAGRLHVLRNNVDSQGRSFGCHENYLVRRTRDFHEVAGALVAFFVTRQVVAGAGSAATSGSTPGYRFSERADQTLETVSSATTRARPIINTRDEPLADAGAYRRLHVIVGDTTMAEPTLALKVGSAEMLLGALEEGADVRELALAQPMTAIRAVNADLTGRIPLELANGEWRSAAWLQGQFLARVRAWADSADLDRTHRYVLDLWGRAVDAVAAGDWSTIDTEIDFAIKKRLLDAYRARSGAGPRDVRLARLELAYHDITAGGLRPRLEAAGLMRRLSTPEQVARARTTPPATTRAALRGRLLAAAQEYRRDLVADWMHVRLQDEPSAPLTLTDPFAHEDPRVDALLARIASAPRPLPA